jgi:ABC-type branched-subunit amino acid transport system substrate-binding protein
MSLIERILSYLGWCPSKKAASDFRPKMGKSPLRSPSVIIMAVAILGMFTFIYYNSTRQINYIPICVVPPSMDVRALVDLVEKDINQYCEENGYRQRFNFVSKEHSIWSLEETRVFMDSIIREDFKLVVGFSGSTGYRIALESLEKQDMFFVSPGSRTSDVTNASNRFFGVDVETPRIDVTIQSALADGIRAFVVIQGSSYREELEYQETEELLQSSGGVVFDRIVLPGMLDSISNIINENDNFTLQCVAANEAVKLASEEHGLHEVGVLFIGNDNVYPVLYQSRGLDLLLEVPWFWYRGVTDFESFPWAMEYAHKVGLYHPKTAVDSPKMMDGQVTVGIDQVQARLMSWEDSAFSAEGAKLYDSCWLMALSVLEAGSTEPSEVSKVFRHVAEGYDGLLGNYALNEAGDRYRFRVGVFKFNLEKIFSIIKTYELVQCATYDAELGRILLFDNFALTTEGSSS